MPEVPEYDAVLSGTAAATLVAISKVRQRQVIRLVFQLAKHPMRLGDYSMADETGRPLQNVVLGDWHFTYWADHATRELRITEIAEL